MENQAERSREADEIIRGNATGFAQKISAGAHQVVAEEPLKLGGTDTGPGPYDFLLAALGACTSMTVSMYCKTHLMNAKKVGTPRRGVRLASGPTSY